MSPQAPLLLDAFRALHPGAPGSLAAALDELVATSAAAFPNFTLEPAVFARHLAAHTPKGEEPEAWLKTLRGPELYLACACAAGVAPALAAFDEAYLAQLAALVPRARLTPEALDELRQRLRENLLLPREGRPPRIAGY